MKAKVVLIGDSGVGKTSLILRFLYDVYEENPQSSIVMNTYSKNIICEDQNIKLEIWDTAGQERYRAFVPLTYRDANVILMTFALNDEQSLNNLGNWENSISQYLQSNEVPLESNKSFQIFFVATKSDTLNVEDQTAMMKKAQDKFRNVDSKYFFITSSLKGSGINEMFESIAQIIIENDISTKNEGLRIDDNKDDENNDKNNENRSCC